MVQLIMWMCCCLCIDKGNESNTENPGCVDATEDSIKQVSILILLFQFSREQSTPEDTTSYLAPLYCETQEMQVSIFRAKKNLGNFTTQYSQSGEKKILNLVTLSQQEDNSLNVTSLMASNCTK